jgi:type I restriction enzyme R subunit
MQQEKITLSQLETFLFKAADILRGKMVERELKLTGFWESIPARNKLRAELLMLFVSPRFKGLPGIVARRDALISRVLEIAERNNDAILYAT